MAYSSHRGTLFAHDSLPHHIFIAWLSAHPPPTMPCEIGKPKKGPDYHRLRAQHLKQGQTPSSAQPHFHSSVSLGSPSRASLSTVQNRDTEDINPVFVEEEFPLVPPQSPQASHLVDSSALHGYFLNSPRGGGGGGGGGLFTHWLWNTSEYPIMEETPPSTTGELVPTTACLDTMLSPSVNSESVTPPTCSSQ
jgi:hypothetical protein